MRAPPGRGTSGPAPDGRNLSCVHEEFCRKYDKSLSRLQAVLANKGEPLPPRVPLVSERSVFLEGVSPAADRVASFLARALEATGADAPTTAGDLVPWICDALPAIT